MTSYPKTVDKFIPWTKAMVAGATVDKPNYGKKMTGKKHRNKRKRVKRKIHRRQRAKKD